MNHPTRPAPASEPTRSGVSVPGTIGFDLYVSLYAPRAALAPAKLPALADLQHA